MSRISSLVDSGALFGGARCAFFLYVSGLISHSWSRFLPTLNGLSTWTLDGSVSPLTPGFEARRAALWSPLLQWALFLFSRRVYLGLMSWEYETAMDEADERDGKESCLLYGSGPLISHFRARAFQVWVYALPSMPLLLWESLLKPRSQSGRDSSYAVEPTDLDRLPGIFWILLVSLFSTGFYRIFLSFLRFHYGTLVWTQPLRTGVVLSVLGRTVQYGFLY
jgi:hypothetical protein